MQGKYGRWVYCGPWIDWVNYSPAKALGRLPDASRYLCSDAQSLLTVYFAMTYFSSGDLSTSQRASCDLVDSIRSRDVLKNEHSPQHSVPSGLAGERRLDQSLTESPSQATADQALPKASVVASREGIELQSVKPGLLVRFVEIVVSATALGVLWPIMLGVALIIRRGTPGPALFFQNRVGLNFQPFKFCKYRTFFADAKQRFPSLYAYQYEASEIEQLKFKRQDDPRVTPQGVWLRKSSLDELPNFWNVLTGQMALVGPRPEIPEMLPYYQGEMLQKFTVRPGITGLAQISGRGDLSFLETVDYDLEYVRNKSWWLDIKILFCTLFRIVLRDGAF